MELMTQLAWYECIQWFYYLRIPLLTVLVLTFLPTLMLSGWRRRLFANLVRDLSTVEVGVVTFFSLLAAMPIVIGSKFIVRGYERFGLPKLPAPPKDALIIKAAYGLTLNDWSEDPLLLSWLVVCSIMAGMICAFVVWLKSRNRDGRGFIAFLTGVVVAWAFSGVIVRTFYDWLAEKLPLGPRSDIEWLKGYLETDVLRQTHAVAFVLLLCWLLLYSSITAGKWFTIAKAVKRAPGAGLGESSPIIPTFAYLLILFTFTNWFFSSATFFLDYFGFSGIFVVLIALLGLGSFVKRDHYYSVTKLDEPLPAPRAAEILLEGHPAGSPQKVILVGAAGGGIQAAAWTAQVLAGIESWLIEKRGEQKATDADWRRALRLVSGVSGGAVGLYHYIDKWPENEDHLKPERRASALKDAIRGGRASSLEAIGWGLAGPDFWRIFAPPLFRGRLRFIDRGWALEAALSS